MCHDCDFSNCCRLMHHGARGRRRSLVARRGPRRRTWRSYSAHWRSIRIAIFVCWQVPCMRVLRCVFFP